VVIFRKETGILLRHFPPVFTEGIDSSMAIKKSELYSSLWASCDELRGGMDASQYKDYVLVLLFMKYVSCWNSQE
jgi:hypothetical protein